MKLSFKTMLLTAVLALFSSFGLAADRDIEKLEFVIVKNSAFFNELIGQSNYIILDGQIHKNIDFITSDKSEGCQVTHSDKMVDGKEFIFSGVQVIDTNSFTATTLYLQPWDNSPIISISCNSKDMKEFSLDEIIKHFKGALVFRMDRGYED